MRLSRTLVWLFHHGRTQVVRNLFPKHNTLSPIHSVQLRRSFSNDSANDDDKITEDLNNDRYVKKWLATKVFEHQTIDDFKPFLKNKEELEKMEWILQEYEIIKYDTSLCPSYLPTERVKEMVEMSTTQKLHSYFHFLYNRENRKNAARLRKIENRTETAKALRFAHDNDIKLEMGISYDPETGKPIYGKWRNSCFIDLGKKHEYTAFLPQNIAASQFGQKLIIDFSYENCMHTQEKKSLVKQLCFGYQKIRESEDPFDLWFCGLNPKEKTHSYLDEVLGWNRNAIFTNSFIHRTERSYLDLFPKEKLVYLCPDSSVDLHKFDDEAIYIVGGLVDKRVIKPVSLAKCKKEGLKTARLPLDQHLSMIGNKILTLDQVLCILVRLKEGVPM
uniref:RNA (guanine-9-)-methyltransferase domain-containing protein 1 n=2 Tax=Tetranychus urticae TaxID=32264 RepID=T1JQQ1_TETUR